MSEKKTTKSKFTPGPWEVEGATRVAKFGKDWACIAQVSDPRPSEDSFAKHEPVGIGSDRFDEACANAMLMSAAPELYAALDEAVGFIAAFAGGYQATQNLKDIHPTHAECLRKALAALAKAGSESAASTINRLFPALSAQPEGEDAN